MGKYLADGIPDHDITVRHGHSPFHGILKLPDVALPGKRLQRLQKCRFKAGYILKAW
jgi:hypothetical protein